MRLFIAFWPDSEIRRQITSIQMRYSGSGKPVRPENFHLTAAFLGQVEENRVPELHAMIEKIQLPRTKLPLDRLGWFRRSQVFWLGCRQTPEALLEAVLDLSRWLEVAGFKTDNRPWQPHVTLYRKMRTEPEIIDPAPVTWPITSLVLVASETRPEGVKYRLVDQGEVV